MTDRGLVTELRSPSWPASQEAEHLREHRDMERETRLQELEDVEHRRDYQPREGSDMEGAA